jgi:hypothetical protein
MIKNDFEKPRAGPPTGGTVAKIVNRNNLPDCSVNIYISTSNAPVKNS